MAFEKGIRKVKDKLSLIDDTIRDINNRVEGGGSFSFDMLLETPIEEYCLIPMADYQLRKHMMLNMYMRDIMLTSAPDVSGISNIVSGEVSESDYSYVDGNNYLNEFQRIDAKHTATRQGVRSDNILKYGNGKVSSFSNQLYGDIINL